MQGAWWNLIVWVSGVRWEGLSLVVLTTCAEIIIRDDNDYGTEYVVIEHQQQSFFRTSLTWTIRFYQTMAHLDSNFLQEFELKWDLLSCISLILSLTSTQLGWKGVLYSFFQAAESNRKPDQTSRFYAKGALQYLTPLLTDSLKRQVCGLKISQLNPY